MSRHIGKYSGISAAGGGGGGGYGGNGGNGTASGGGGGGGYGDGGDAGLSYTDENNEWSAVMGQNGTYGGGGGGLHLSSSVDESVTAGNGGSGICIIQYYVEKSA